MFASLVAMNGFHLLLSTQLTADLTEEWSGGSMFHPLSHVYAKTPFCHVEIVAINTSAIQSVVCNYFNTTKRSFCINMWQWMKHRSTTSLFSQTSSQLSGQQQVKTVHSNQRCKHQQANVLLLYFDLRPGPKILFQGNTPEGSDTFQRPVIERDRVGGLRLMIWDKVKVPLCHYSHALEESNLWTAWQLFPLVDD